MKPIELTDGRLEKLHKLSENEILFEAANTLRMGKDLLFKIILWKRQGWEMVTIYCGGDYNMHVTDSIYRSSHIDSALRPGLILVNSEEQKKIFQKYLISGKRFILKKSHQHHQKSWT